MLLVNASGIWVRYSCRQRAMKASLTFLLFLLYPPVLLTAKFAYAQHLNPRTLSQLCSPGSCLVFNTAFLAQFPLEIRLKSQVVGAQ